MSELNNEKLLSEKDLFNLAAMWEQLKTENSPLRVVENGSVISSDISYYDDLIRSEFPKDTCSIAYIIGSALGKHKILTGDYFIAKRIEEFIKLGELQIIDHTDKEFYGATVKCTK